MFRKNKKNLGEQATPELLPKHTGEKRKSSSLESSGENPEKK